MLLFNTTLAIITYYILYTLFIQIYLIYCNVYLKRLRFNYLKFPKELGNVIFKKNSSIFRTLL